MNPRRYLLCCEQYTPSVGGVQEVMRQVAERLVGRGHSVTVATRAHPQRAAEAWINGVRIVSFQVDGNAVRGLRGEVAAYRSFLSEESADAILIKAAQQWTFDAAVEVLPTMLCRKIFIPCGFSGLHNPIYADYFREMPRWLALFDALIVYSLTYQDAEFARRCGMAHALHLIANGADEREFADSEAGDIRQRLGIEPGDDLLLSVGSLIAAKGHWEVLEAYDAANLPRPATLVVNGNVPGGHPFAGLKRMLKHLASGRLPLNWEARLLNRRHRGAETRRRVVLVDLPRPDLVALYKAADLFVFASHVEYSPLVLFEAAASATPFISSDVGNAREIAKWTGAGVVVSGHPVFSRTELVESLTDTLASILRNKLTLDQLRASARRNIFERGFTWNRIVKQYETLLNG